MRTAEIKRKTKETDILLTLNLDGSGESDINTGCGFLDHMLTLLAKQARINLSVRCNGDINVDYHHTVEDVGIALGKAYAQALGDKRGINRYGFFILPMDESLILSSLDFSGRAFLGYDVPLRAKKVGDFDTELAEEFWLGFVRNAAVSLHIKKLAGTNTHHILEGCFKSVGKSLRLASSIDETLGGEITSTKGLL